MRLRISVPEKHLTRISDGVVLHIVQSALIHLKQPPINKDEDWHVFAQFNAQLHIREIKTAGRRLGREYLSVDHNMTSADHCELVVPNCGEWRNTATYCPRRKL